MEKISCISPIDSKELVSRNILADDQLMSTIQAAQKAQRSWAALSLEDRSAYMEKFLTAIEQLNSEIVPELAKQMGRPIRYNGELSPLQERVRYMIDIAASSLADLNPGHNPAIKRFIKREPLGVVLVVAPWNYPFLTAINGIVPALLAGNVVVLKHASQTILVGERIAQAFEMAGLPAGVFTNVVISHQQTEKLLQSGLINHLNFTGSVSAGRRLENIAGGSFCTMNLELGGKDGAFVRADANLDKTIAELVSGAYYNSGQCCCGIERIYVDKSIYKEFLDRFTEAAQQWKLGNPLDQATTLGPMASISFAKAVEQQIEQAVHAGAQTLIDVNLFKPDRISDAYLGPQALINVDHTMTVMTEESFGPVVGIMPVNSDEQAIELINDSKYGLTSSIWTADLAAAESIGRQLQTGVVFMNRCDYLDPGLAWAGMKETGRGASLSKFGFDCLTRPKSFHLRHDF